MLNNGPNYNLQGFSCRISTCFDRKCAEKNRIHSLDHYHHHYSGVSEGMKILGIPTALFIQVWHPLSSLSHFWVITHLRVLLESLKSSISHVQNIYNFIEFLQNLNMTTKAFLGPIWINWINHAVKKDIYFVFMNSHYLPATWAAIFAK